MTQAPALQACVITPTGSRPAELADIPGIRASGKGLVWVHIQGEYLAAHDLIEAHFDETKLDPLLVDALTTEDARPRLLHHEGQTLMLLRGINHNDPAEPEDMISIRLIVDDNLVITVIRRNSRSIHDLRKRLDAGRGFTCVGEFVVELIDRLNINMEETFNHLDNTADDLEENILESADAHRRQNIIDSRTGTIQIRRYLAPQRDLLSELRLSAPSWLRPKDVRKLLECHSNLVKNIEDLDLIRDRLQIMQEEVTNVISERLNRNLYVLSLVAAIFLPISFLTGLLGINVGGMPGADSPYAFWVVCGLLLAVVVLQYFLFRKLKWL